MAGAQPDFDVAIVGASVAGCTAARLFAERGARVALIERRSDPDAYKVVCTHAVLPLATPVIERLGIAPKLTERGVPRTWLEFFTPYSGWFGLPDDARGWGVTRHTLDPLLRELAASTPGVELLAGLTAKRVLFDGSRPAGVELEDRNHRPTAIRARLLVGADGRGSAVARLAGVPGRVRPHNRFFYFAYWSGIDYAPQRQRRAARLWVLDRNGTVEAPNDGAAQFPNEDGLTVLVATYRRGWLDTVRADPERAYMRAITQLPDGPGLDGAERVSKVLGKLDVPNVLRPAARPGIAFVGDAALATDPLFGVGISFAFQSAAWLVDATSGALRDARELDRGLGRYARRFAWRLWPHHLQIADFSTARDLTPVERYVFRKAAGDPVVARALGDVATRERSPLRMLEPRVVKRLVA